MLDLVSADQGSNLVSSFSGRGDGTFDRPPRTLITGEMPAALVAAELNGDGVLDLVSADQGSNRLSLFLGGSRKPPSPAFFGTTRPAAPILGVSGGEALIFEARDRPYFLHTGTGTIDGVRFPGFRGHGFSMASLQIKKGARVIAAGEFPLCLLVTGEVSIAGELSGDGEPAADAGA